MSGRKGARPTPGKSLGHTFHGGMILDSRDQHISLGRRTHLARLVDRGMQSRAAVPTCHGDDGQTRPGLTVMPTISAV